MLVMMKVVEHWREFERDMHENVKKKTKAEEEEVEVLLEEIVMMLMAAVVVVVEMEYVEIRWLDYPEIVPLILVNWGYSFELIPECN